MVRTISHLRKQSPTHLKKGWQEIQVVKDAVQHPNSRKGNYKADKTVRQPIS